MKKTIYLLASLVFGINAPSAWAQCTASTANQSLGINNVSTLIHSSADLYWDFNGPRYEVPKGTGLSTTFSGGLWMGGKDASGQLRMAVSKYRQAGVDFWPGPINSSGNASDCSAFDRIWKVSQQDIQNFKQNPSSMTNDIKEWPAKNNPNLNTAIPDELAPFVDMDGDGNYDPSKGDYPVIQGDEALYTVFNDVGSVHTESGSSPIGIEVRLMAYSISSNNHLNNTTFYEYEVINKGNFQLNDFYLGIFTDFDLGGPNDDFAGCDTNRNMGFVYNGDPFDADARGMKGYGANPPLAAIKMVRDVKIGSSTFPMSSFKALMNQSSMDPSRATEFYSLMQGLNKLGSPDTNRNGQTVKFQYAGPLGVVGDNECSMGNTPNDRRILMNYGPMNFKPNEKMTFTFANIYARSANSTYDACTNGAYPLLEAADSVQSYIQNSAPTSTQDYQVSKVDVYPNPVHNWLNLNGVPLNAEVQIWSLNGQLEYTQELNEPSAQLNIASLESGIHLLKILDQGNVVGIHRLVKD